jgi:hypothetical protein
MAGRLVKQDDSATFKEVKSVKTNYGTISGEQLQL